MEYVGRFQTVHEIKEGRLVERIVDLVKERLPKEPTLEEINDLYNPEKKVTISHQASETAKAAIKEAKTKKEVD